MGLAFVGVFVPLLPTVPFVLLAAICFSKSSDRFHSWLMAHRHFGPIIHNWQTNRSMPKRVKIMAMATIFCSGALSIYMITAISLKLLVATLLLIPVFIILRLPSSENLVPSTLKNHAN